MWILSLWIFYNTVTILVNIIIPLILNIVLMLLITLVIASLTLMERKVLSLMQRRVGPYFVGYRGRLQYIADALKLFIKGTLIPEEANKFWPKYFGSFLLYSESFKLLFISWGNNTKSPNIFLVLWNSSSDSNCSEYLSKWSTTFERKRHKRDAHRWIR